MAAVTQERLPGLTLHLKEQSLQPCAGKELVATGFVVLRAEVHDLQVWDAVVEKLDGMVVYTVNNLADALFTAVQDRANKAEERTLSVAERARVEIDALSARLAFTEEQALNSQRQVVELKQENAILNELIDIKDAELQGFRL